MAQTASVPVSAAAIALGLEDARERACFIRSVVAAQAADPNPYVLALKYCGCILCVGVSCALSLAGTCQLYALSCAPLAGSLERC